jgi:YVTN family beta-propeller protein
MKNYPSWRSLGAWSAAVLLFVGLSAPAAWSAPYAYVANYSSGTVSVIDTATDLVALTMNLGTHPYGDAVSPDGSRVYVSNLNSDTISVIDTANDQVVATVNVGVGPDGVAVSPDGSRVYVTNSGSNTVSVIDTANDQVVATVNVGSGPHGVAVSPDGSRVYVVNYNSDTVSVINTENDQVVATVNVGYLPQGVAVSPDGSRVYVTNACASSTSCSGNGTVSVIDTANDQVVATVDAGFDADDAVVSPDGSQVYVTNDCGSSSSCSGNGTVSVIDTANDLVMATVNVGSGPQGVAVSPDGSRVYVTNGGSNTVSVIDTANDLVANTIPVGTDPISLGDFVGPGALIASNSSASGGAGTQISGTVPTLVNGTSCATTDEVVQQPAHGSVVFLSSTGAFTYTPSLPTYSGTDAFTWQGGATGSCPSADAPTDPVSNTATVTLTIDPQILGLANLALGENDVTYETFSFTGSTPFTYTLASSNGAVLPLKDLMVNPAACGAMENLDCSLTISSSSVTGTSEVTVSATDAHGDTVQKTIAVTVVPPSAPGSSSGGGSGGMSPLGLLMLGVLVLFGRWGQRRSHSHG